MDERASIELSSSETFLLRWLAAGEGSIGECRGPSLDTLLRHGLATLDDPKVPRNYVVITEAGRQWMAERKLEAYNGYN